jgi:peroxiredoxin
MLSSHRHSSAASGRTSRKGYPLSLGATSDGNAGSESHPGSQSMNAERNYGIPDLELPLPKGGTVNPTDFVGHELVVLFPPLDRAAAARELADYNRHADQLSYNDAWMIAVANDTETQPASRITLAVDPHLAAWRAFGDSLDPSKRFPREEGAVFLFGRGGCLTRAWQGSGHASDVVKELGERM